MTQGEEPRSEQELEERLSAPDDATSRALGDLDGDILILGAGGKMGPTLARMARRALDATGSTRRVIAVSRFTDRDVADRLVATGVEVVRADLADPVQVHALPESPNVLWLAGQKFGTSGDPVLTWTHNVLAPSYAAERFGGSRIVCFSTGNVYGRSNVSRGGSREEDPLIPDGEYAASCIGRERVFEAVSRRTAGALLLYRLFYACDLRYGVVTDLARRVLAGTPITLTTAWVNVIWQGDANRLALRALGHARLPPLAINATGPIVSVEQVALELGARLGREPVFEGPAGSDALVANVEALDRLMPYEPLPRGTLLDWTARWVGRGGRVLDKPTKFEVRDGRF